jgi:hypothetical protein
VCLDRKVRDLVEDRPIWTITPDHVVVVLDQHSSENTDEWEWENFSTVLGAAEILDIEFVDTTGYQVDQRLLALLNKTLEA